MDAEKLMLIRTRDEKSDPNAGNWLVVAHAA
jgi:hypothetical protein